MFDLELESLLLVCHFDNYRFPLLAVDALHCEIFLSAAVGIDLSVRRRITRIYNEVYLEYKQCYVKDMDR